jgi:hypothetical protein
LGILIDDLRNWRKIGGPEVIDGVLYVAICLLSGLKTCDNPLICESNIVGKLCLTFIAGDQDKLIIFKDPNLG